MGELSAASRMMAASRIYNAVQSSFAHGEVLPPGTIEESFEAFVKAIADNADRRHFDFEAMRFAAALKNGHSAFTTHGFLKRRNAASLLRSAAGTGWLDRHV